MNKKALIVTYYWPPAGGSGVQRWLYFVKYLSEFGIEPIVFTVEHPHYAILDRGLENEIPDGVEVIRHKIWEPARFSNKNAQIGNGFLPQRSTFFQKIKNYIRANIFIPDAKMFWIRPASKKIEKYLQTHAVDWLITTGPPHSMHMIGKRIKNKTGIKWLTDFRDPWTEIDYFHHLPLTKRSFQKHEIMEKEVLALADVVTVVSQSMKTSFDKSTSNCQVITNGYDDAILSKIPEMDKPFTITHIGMLNADRNPEILWEVFAEMVEADETFEANLQINLVGNIADEVKQSIRHFELERFVNYTQYVPNHAVAAMQMKSQVLLLLVNQVPNAKSIVTGKIFEYLRAQRPIIALAPTDGDLAKIIEETKSGIVVDFQDKSLLQVAIQNYFDLYLKGALKVSSVNIAQYHRKNLTEQLSKLLLNH